MDSKETPFDVASVHNFLRGDKKHSCRILYCAYLSYILYSMLRWLNAVPTWDGYCHKPGYLPLKQIQDSGMIYQVRYLSFKLRGRGLDCSLENVLYEEFYRPALAESVLFLILAIQQQPDITQLVASGKDTNCNVGCWAWECQWFIHWMCTDWTAFKQASLLLWLVFRDPTSQLSALACAPFPIREN